jgi:hypothetical protein
MAWYRDSFTFLPFYWTLRKLYHPPNSVGTVITATSSLNFRNTILPTLSRVVECKGHAGLIQLLLQTCIEGVGGAQSVHRAFPQLLPNLFIIYLSSFTSTLLSAITDRFKRLQRWPRIAFKAITQLIIRHSRPTIVDQSISSQKLKRKASCPWERVSSSQSPAEVSDGHGGLFHQGITKCKRNGSYAHQETGNFNRKL